MELDTTCILSIVIFIVMIWFLISWFVIINDNDSECKGKCNKYVWDNSTGIECTKGTYSDKGTGFTPCTKCTDCTELGGVATPCTMKTNSVCNNDTTPSPDTPV